MHCPRRGTFPKHTHALHVRKKQGAGKACKPSLLAPEGDIRSDTRAAGRIDPTLPVPEWEGGPW